MNENLDIQALNEALKKVFSSQEIDQKATLSLLEEGASADVSVNLGITEHPYATFGIRCGGSYANGSMIHFDVEAPSAALAVLKNSKLVAEVIVRSVGLAVQQCGLPESLLTSFIQSDVFRATVVQWMKAHPIPDAETRAKQAIAELL